jgi:hypothetical protein
MRRNINGVNVEMNPEKFAGEKGTPIPYLPQEPGARCV